jgi:FkbM family methyltransferase
MIKKLLYYLLNFLFFHNWENEFSKNLHKIKKPIIFDIGCDRGVFSRTIFKRIKNINKSYQFYLFDINKNVKRYLSDLTIKKNFKFNEIALSNKKGSANYYYNNFFESSGSSLSKLTKNDKNWILSRKIILRLLMQRLGNFSKHLVKTTTIDLFIKTNKINKIDLLKIDVDGTEFDVLKGAKKTLSKNSIKIIFVEIATTKKNFQKKERKISNFLKKRNFFFVKKFMMITPSFFSNIKTGDYLFINKKYKKFFNY